MARNRHFLNLGKGNDITFATTTCLDFANLFERPEIRTQLVALIRESCAIKSVRLHAYVVMHNHIHLLMHLGPETTVSSYMNSFKAYTAREIGQKLTVAEKQTLSDQNGLGRRTFWQRSFRSVVIDGEEMFMQKVNYIHQNPVRAKLVEEPNIYEWSSASLWEAGHWALDTGLQY